MHASKDYLNLQQKHCSFMFLFLCRLYISRYQPFLSCRFYLIFCLNRAVICSSVFPFFLPVLILLIYFTYYLLNHLASILMLPKPQCSCLHEKKKKKKRRISFFFFSLRGLNQ